MKARVEESNDASIRLPKELLDKAELPAHTDVEITFRAGRIVIQDKSKKLPTLDELVDQITPENRHPATDWGPPRGREVW